MNFEPKRATVAVRPRSQEIFERLREDITEGRYDVGDRVPSEKVLCQQLGASRHAVREAMRRLEDAGMITRRQGAASVVRVRSVNGRFHNPISSLEELMQYAASTQLEVLAVEKILVEGATADLLRSPAGTPWVRVSALRRRAEERQPLCYTEIFIPAAYSDVAAEIGGAHTAVYEIIESRHGVRVTDVLQSIEAGSADANLASRLHVDIGVPILVITRHYMASDGKAVEVAVNAHPADRYVYQMTLRRAG